MKTFFSQFSASLLAIIVAGFGFAAFSLLGLIAIGTLFGGSPPMVPKNSVLVVDLSMNISDTPKVLSPSEVINEALSGETLPTVHLKALIDSIDSAAENDRITRMFVHGSLRSQNYGSSFPQLRELREAIMRFGTNKPVTAYTVGPSLHDYYVMTAADELVLNPFGYIELKGLAAELFFLGPALDRAGIGIQVSKVGKYKSFADMLTREDMSPEDREQTIALLESIWGDLIDDLAKARGIDRASLVRQINREGIFQPTQAKNIGLVDRVAYLDEVVEELISATAYDKEISSFRQVNIVDLIEQKQIEDAAQISRGNRQIAIVYAEGDIVYGEGYSDQVGGDRVARTLRQLRQDPAVKGIVLRVNSPGGSAVASEIIEREIRLTLEEKPVVVSMGGYAASGGYWISASANKIFAEETTITGSIGVFGIYPNIGELAENLGVHFDGVKTAEFADIYSISRPKTEKELTVLQEFVDEIYKTFIEKVAEGREMSIEDVEAIAQGRVWSGADAVEVGLVDEIGGLEDAIEYAANRAGLSTWNIEQYPSPQSPEEFLSSLLAGGDGSPPVIQTDPVSRQIAYLREELEKLRAFNDPQGFYARMPLGFRMR